MAENNIYFNGYDPLLSSSDMTTDEMREQLTELRRMKQELASGKSVQQEKKGESIWNMIDAEIMPLTDSQKGLLFNDEEYRMNEESLMNLIQSEIVNFIRPRVEQSAEGKKILEAQYKLVKARKGAVIAESNKEAELFNAFREASANNPELTYAVFLEQINKQ